MAIPEHGYSAAKYARQIVGTLRRIFAVIREKYYRIKIGQPDRRHCITAEIATHGDFSTLPEAISVGLSLDRAMNNIGGPPDYIRQIVGMSGQKYRTFINNLVGLTEDARYLEVGCWRGSTATAALFGNNAAALCIDNWTQFGGPKHEFLENIERVRPNFTNFQFIEIDFRRVEYNSIGTFNIFLFDGPHEERDQYDGIVLARVAMADVFILIVDDWNWRQVRIGTFRAISDSRYTIVSSIEIRTTRDNCLPKLQDYSNSDWHNGYYICVIKANKNHIAGWVARQS